MRWILTVLLLGCLALPARADHKLNLYADTSFDLASRDSSGQEESVNTRIALGYLISGHLEAGLQATQDAENRSIQDIGVFVRLNLSTGTSWTS